MMHGLVGEFELGRKAYRDQDWKRSEAHFMNCMKIKPGDGPTELYLARVQSFMKESPGDKWDGVYTFKHK
jgi:adenylate cyclase